MFGPAGQQNFSNLQLAKVGRQLDFFNMQGYDFHGTWETSTNHASPLFDDKQDPDASENFYIEYTVRSYLEAASRESSSWAFLRMRAAGLAFPAPTMACIKRQPVPLRFLLPIICKRPA